MISILVLEQNQCLIHLVIIPNEFIRNLVFSPWGRASAQLDVLGFQPSLSNASTPTLIYEQLVQLKASTREQRNRLQYKFKIEVKKEKCLLQLTLPVVSAFNSSYWIWTTNSARVNPRVNLRVTTLIGVVHCVVWCICWIKENTFVTCHSPPRLAQGWLAEDGKDQFRRKPCSNCWLAILLTKWLVISPDWLLFSI